jgi:NADPH:quinone reductase-like Zn-dependent oxidoreductase
VPAGGNLRRGMRAAVLHDFGTPRFGDFAEPAAGDGHVVVDVAAAGVNHVDLAIASGTFYTGPPPLPSVPGTDAVGRLPDGRRVYVDATVAPYGCMAERTLVADGHFIEIPEGVDDAVAATLGNAGLAAWLSLEWRAHVASGETVLVLGATGTVGQIAVQAARLLGAGRVVAAGRDERRLRRATELGADAAVALDAADDAEEALREAADGGFDVILDLLWGAPAEAAMGAGAVGARLVQVGQMAGATATLPAATVRSRSLAILGYANFHAPQEVRASAYRRLADHARHGRVAIDLERIALRDVEHAWARQRAGVDRKLVVIP